MSPALDSAQIQAANERLADQVFKAHEGGVIDLVGIRSRGDEVAERVLQILKSKGANVRLGVLDISLYRDDYEHLSSNPTLQSSEIDFPVDGAHIVLVDDVIFTGRTIRAALDALFDYGRPSKVELAVLIDRGHREIPVEPNFVGAILPTQRMDRVDVSLQKTDGRESVEIITY
ncbi:MAG: bifunctional pyr operon transcriptional regulator/uracil phosphoribosyltransferase PyrR [Akkermansiaceae bacterium]